MCVSSEGALHILRPLSRCDRYEPQILQHPSLLPYLKEKRSDSQPPLDLLLLDNTYDDPSTDAPKRPAAAETLCQLIQAFPLHKIWLGIDSLGKEELFPLIAKAAGGPVCINPDRLASLQAIGDPALLSSEVVTTDEFQSRVLVMSRQSVTPAAVIAANLKARKLHEQTLQASSTASSSDATQTLDDVNDHAVQHSAKRQRVSGEGVQSPFPLSPEAVHAMAPVIGLVATNWKTQALNTSRLSSLPHECMQHAKTAGRSDALPCEYSLARHPETQDPLVAFVPYSLHSTYSELREFVGALRPRHLIPTSRCSPDQVNAFHQHFDDLLLDSSSHTPRCGRSLARKARPLVQTLQANRQSAMSTSKLQRSVSLPTSSKARPSRAVERKIVKMKAKSWLSKLSIPF